MADIYSNIKTLRMAKNMTLEEVGKALGVSRQTVNRYETGEIKGIPYEKICMLSDLFKVSPTELLGYEEIKLDANKASEHFEILDLYERLSDVNKSIVKNLMTDMLNNQ